MKHFLRLLLAPMFVLSLLFPVILGCEQGPAEEAGEAIDEAAEDVGDALD